MTEDELSELLRRSESETLDFKQDDYDLSIAEKRGEFIKDILAMANTPRDTDSHIVLGVQWNAENGSAVIGLSAQRDDAKYQDMLSDTKVSPRPHFRYTPLLMDGKQVGVLTIPPQKGGPFTPINDSPGLQAGAIYFRRGSMKTRAVGADFRRVSAWFETGRNDLNGEQPLPSWRSFLRDIGGFSPKIKYILIADLMSQEVGPAIEAVGLVPWRAVIDLDPASETGGLLSRLANQLRSRQVVHRALANDLRVQPEPGIHWYFASGVDASTPVTEHRDWLKCHKRGLSAQLGALQASIGPAPICFIAIWSDSPSARLRTVMEEIQGAFGDNCTIAVVGQDRPVIEPLCEDVGASFFEMSLHGLCAGIASTLSPIAGTPAETMRLPTASGAPLELGPDDAPWLAEDLEIVHLAAGLEGDSTPRPFRLGAEVSWRNLQLGQDCARDLSAQVRTQVEDDLRRRETVRINIYHAPGAGGSTAGRRILWEFHERYPAVVLHNCDARLTAERIARVSTLTESGILILVDGGRHSEGEIDELFDHLKAQQVRAVIVQVLRRFSPQKEGRRQFWLPTELSEIEADRFQNALSAEVPSARKSLAKLAKGPSKLRSSFFFGLAAFGRDFSALENYVMVRLAPLSDDQKKVLTFLSLAHYYGQQSLPVQAFASLLGLPPSRPVSLENMFQGHSSIALELLIEEPADEWRTAHNAIALEILQQVLARGTKEDRGSVWRQGLSTWSKMLADFLRSDGPVASERLLELTRRVFVYRDNAEILGTERASGRRFSQLLEDIPSPQGRVEVMRHLSTLFPGESHFHAHLGRLLGMQGEFKSALEEVAFAIELSPRDPVLHHMRGMILRYDMRANFEIRRDPMEIIPIVADAQNCFANAREIDPDGEHSYVSEIQLLLDFLDYAARQHKRTAQDYLSDQSTHAFFRNALERIETLLDRVNQLYVGETPSPYIGECQARAQGIYGDFGKALSSFDNLLSRPDVAKSSVRRQIVWTILRRHNGVWADLSKREVDRVKRFLEENLEEETKDSTSLRLWLRVVRFSGAQPSLDSIIERVAYWKHNTGSLDAAYYLYVLHTLRALDGSAQALSDMDRALDDTRALARYRRDRTRSLEWIGTGEGIRKLIHQSQLGEWQNDFRASACLLSRMNARVKSIDGPQKGIIELATGIEAFFVPGRSDIHAGRDENVPVTCYIGFSYDGLRAWSVARSQ